MKYLNEQNIHCSLCSHSFDFDSKYTSKNRTHKVEKPSISSIRAVSKRGDILASEVEILLSGCIDIVTSEEEYHRQCRQNFYSNRSKNDKKKVGRHKDEDLRDKSIQLYDWPEKQAKSYTLKEL